MPRKIERCLCQLVSLNGKHPMSRDKSLARPTVYASRRVVNTEDYWSSLTIEPIKFSVGLIDSLGLNPIIKMFLLFPMPYEQRYYNTMFESRNFHFKKRHRRPGCEVRMRCPFSDAWGTSYQALLMICMFILVLRLINDKDRMTH